MIISRSYFICNNWLAVEKGDGLVDRIIPLASEKELKSFAHLFTQSVKKKFSDGHLWFSVFSRPVRSNFTRFQRVSCCISLLFCTMISNAMFYQQETRTTSNSAGTLLTIGPITFTLTQLWVSFIGTLIVLPINLIIVTLFRKARYSQKILIKHQLKIRSQQEKRVAKNDEQHKRTTKSVDSSIDDSSVSMNIFRFFSKKKQRTIDTDDDCVPIAAIPSVEDRGRTLPHWNKYVAWACKINSYR